MKSVTPEEVKALIPNQDAAEIRDKEPIFKIEKEVAPANNPLLDIEIAIRKVERLGGFKD